jgi:hypothetical protein
MHFMLELVEARRSRESHHELSLMALACQGDGKAIRKQLAALRKKM